MSDASATAGPSSTPATGDSAVTAPVTTQPAAVAPTTTAAPETKSTEPVVADPAKTDPSKPSADPVKDEPLFKVPDGVKLLPQAQTRFENFVKGKLTDGKLSLTPQEVLDHYLEHAQELNTIWQAQQADLNKANEAECKQRFTPAQLAAAETGVGYLSSFDPQFREVAQAFLNHPTFVNAMRLVGERLSEDSFEPGGGPRQAAKRAPKDVLYGKRN